MDLWMICACGACGGNMTEADIPAISIFVTMSIYTATCITSKRSELGNPIEGRTQLIHDGNSQSVQGTVLTGFANAPVTGSQIELSLILERASLDSRLFGSLWLTRAHTEVHLPLEQCGDSEVASETPAAAERVRSVETMACTFSLPRWFLGPPDTTLDGVESCRFRTHVRRSGDVHPQRQCSNEV